MNLRKFLLSEEWVVYKVNCPNRTFFGDTFFGPMWKKFPDDLILDESEVGMVLDNLSDVDSWLENKV